jgi:hypothetical protein
MHTHTQRQFRVKYYITYKSLVENIKKRRDPLLFLFIHNLFNDDISSSGYAVSDGRNNGLERMRNEVVVA